jgi:hypothetical protein
MVHPTPPLVFSIQGAGSLSRRHHGNLPNVLGPASLSAG